MNKHNVLEYLLPVIHKDDIYYIINAKTDLTNNDVYNNYIKYRPVENQNLDKKILIFGCSFAHGFTLKDNQTFAHKLAKLTKYSVYNRAQAGRSVQHMLFQLENEDFYKIIPKPDYIIYVFIPSQIRRTWINCIYFRRDIFYKRTKNNQLKLLNYSLKYSQSYLLGLFGMFLHDIMSHDYYRNWETDFYFQHIFQSLDEIKKHWNNDVKFIFFMYEDYDNENFYKNLKELENRGGIIVNLSKLSKDNYHAKEYRLNNDHPNAKAWEEITPLFVNYLQKMGYLK